MGLFKMATIDTSDIKVEFGGDSAPEDKRLTDLFKKAYQGKILVCTALIKAEGIKPFSDFKPNISDEFRTYFETQEKENLTPPLYVYPEGEFFIMSDDYSTYYLYKEKGYEEVMCIVIGKTDGEFVIEKSEQFQLPLPEVVG